MGTMASQITSLTIVYSTGCSEADHTQMASNAEYVSIDDVVMLIINEHSIKKQTFFLNQQRRTATH